MIKFEISIVNEFCKNDKFLIKDGVGKFLIREMMKNDLPEEVFNHPKQGFNLPLQKYQNEHFIKLAKRLLFDENPQGFLYDVFALNIVFHIHLAV